MRKVFVREDNGTCIRIYTKTWYIVLLITLSSTNSFKYCNNNIYFCYRMCQTKGDYSHIEHILASNVVCNHNFRNTYIIQNFSLPTLVHIDILTALYNIIYIFLDGFL